MPATGSRTTGSHATDTVVIGAGQAGLAVSRCLADRGLDHVVLEQGRIAQRWDTQRWDSLRLLTPRWMTGLPGRPYRGDDPDGFATAAEFAAGLREYGSGAPIREHTAVVGVDARGAGFSVVTDDGPWACRKVVIATGWCDRPALPAAAAGLASDVVQVAAADYRNPSSLPAGGVLVVGASATGVQLARELAVAGREVVLAVGSHARVPRRYRGRDVYRWLAALGSLDRTIDEVADRVAARSEPSLQLSGAPGDLDLGVLLGLGVRLAGRFRAAEGHRVRFADDLHQTTGDADARLQRLLARIDALADHDQVDAVGGRHGSGHDHAGGGWRPAPIEPGPPLPTLDLRRAGITTVLWATGYRRTYPWLHLPVLDDHGEIRQRRGVTPVPGLYVLGQRFQHYRSSSLIHGVGRDAAFVATHLSREPNKGKKSCALLTTS